MTGNVYPHVKRLVLAVALAVGASGVARADDSSMNPFTGESYSAFNGGHDRSQNANPGFDPAPSAWLQENPDGISERFYQSNSAWGLAWKDPPAFSSASADPSFRQTHPNGMTDGELQALSSEGPAWQLRDRNGAVMASEPGMAMTAQDQNAATQRAASEPFGQRLARFFHVAPANSTR